MSFSRIHSIRNGVDCCISALYVASNKRFTASDEYETNSQSTASLVCRYDLLRGGSDELLHPIQEMIPIALDSAQSCQVLSRP